MGGIGIGQEGWGWWTVSEGEGLTTVFALGCVCASCQGALMASSRSCHCVAQVRKSSERRMGPLEPRPQSHSVRSIPARPHSWLGYPASACGPAHPPVKGGKPLPKETRELGRQRGLGRQVGTSPPCGCLWGGLGSGCTSLW